jgi:site-specific recombinase XerD
MSWKRSLRVLFCRELIRAIRKTWGYQAKKQGVSIEKINEKLGHKSVIVTKRYIGISQEEINLLEEEICI